MKPASLFLFVALFLVGSSIQAQPIATAPTFRGLPVWAFRGFHDSLPTQNTSADVEAKLKFIPQIKNTAPQIAALDTAFGMSDEELAAHSFLADINHDGKQDFVFYGMVDFCNFQPYILIALQRDNGFESIFSREGDFVHWEEFPDYTFIQILVNGCCLDRHGYLYTYDQNSDERFVCWVYWQNGGVFPWIYKGEKEKLVIQRNSVVLLPNTTDSDSLRNQFNWYFCKGDTGQVLATEKVDGEKWLFVIMEAVPNNSEIKLPKADYILGWVSEKDVRIKHPQKRSH